MVDSEAAEVDAERYCPYFIFYIEKLLVAKEGLEPSHPKVHDFESCASANSATRPSAIFQKSTRYCSIVSINQVSVKNNGSTK